MTPTVVDVPVTGMLEELDDLADRLDAFVAEVDPERLEPRVAVAALRTLTRLGRAVSAGEALVAHRVDACNAHVGAGFRSTEQWLASMAGTSQGHAAKLVETGKRLACLDQTAAAVREGKVSVEQAHAVTRAAEADPGSESALLAFAQREPLRRLETRAREVRLAADEDRLGRYERQRTARGVRHGIDDEGMGWGHWRLPPDQHAAVVNRLERQADREYKRVCRDGRREAHDRYVADALVTLCTRRSRESSSGDDADDVAERDLRAEVVVHVSLAQLWEEEPWDGDLCMVRGAGPIPVERVREILRENAFVKGVLHHGTDILRAKHFGRRRPAELDTALEARAVRADGDVICSEDGCDQRFGIEWDHELPLGQGGPTSYGNLKPKCRADHRDKTRRDRQLAATRAGPDPPRQ